MSNKRNKRQREKKARQQKNRQPANLQNSLQLAKQYHQSGDINRAESVYKKLLHADKNNVDALHFYGMLLFQKGEKPDGIKRVKRSLELDPGYADARNNLGNMLRLEGLLEEAETLYKASAELDPKASEPVVNLGVLARSRKQYDEAERLYRKAISIDPDYSVAYLNLGHLLESRGRAKEALEAYSLFESVSGTKDDNIRYRNASLLHSLGKTADSIKIYQEWLEEDPDNPTAMHMLAAIGGSDTPEKPAQGYIKKLFDDFALSFDEVLDNLDYHAPQLCGELVHHLYTEHQNSLQILDAGCGTGLCGKYLHDIAAKLIGVDLSGGMLGQAGRLNLYDELVEADLLEYLHSKRGEFDLIISADTFCYFGSLDELVHDTALALKPSGNLVFTVELTEEEAADGFILNAHGRYSHTHGYLRNVIVETGLSPVKTEEVVLRRESGHPVRGFIVHARKTT